MYIRCFIWFGLKATKLLSRVVQFQSRTYGSCDLVNPLPCVVGKQSSARRHLESERLSTHALSVVLDYLRYQIMVKGRENWMIVGNSTCFARVQHGADCVTASTIFLSYRLHAIR